MATLVVMITALSVGGVFAQDAGEGGPILYPNTGGDPTNFNPILYSDGPSGNIVTQIWTSFLTSSPLTGTYDPGTPAMLVDSWSISDDGQVYTFTLREDLVWSDGTPMTSADVLFSYEALASGDLESPRLEDFPGLVSLEAPDPTTIIMTFSEADCTALEQADTFVPLPAHRLQPEINGDFAALNELDFNLNPDVTSGAFTFSSMRPGEQVVLLANPNYTDTPIGYVAPRGYIQRQLENQGVIPDQFLDRELTVVPSIPIERMFEFRDLGASGELQYNEGLSSGWQFLGFNSADPNNPVDGLDADGNIIEQPPHPLFGDVRIREAVIYGTDHAALNEAAFGGIGVRPASPVLMDSWAYNASLEERAFDQTKAMELLDEAGFIDHDNDPATPRIADGALYAEDGTELSFTITSFSGNDAVDNTILIMQDLLEDIGFNVEIDILEFQTMLEKLDGQNYDTIMLFFGGLSRTNPDSYLRSLFAPDADVVGSGFNSWSYSNSDFMALLDEARTLPGCDQTERKALYDEAQQILHDELPIFVLSTRAVGSAVQPDVENWQPTEFSTFWTLPAWSYELE